jgi:hypothetical protein
MQIKNIIAGVFEKLSLLENPEKIQNKYPLYWLASTTDLGVRQIRLRSLFERDSQHEGTCNVIRFPRVPKFLKFFLLFMGLAAKKDKATPIRVAKLGNCYYAEKGIKRLRLAILLNLECVTVNVVQYDYSSLKSRMRIHKSSNMDVIKLAGINGNGYDYYAITPAHIEVLIKRHKVQSEEPGLAAVKSVAGMEDRLNSGTENAAKNLNKLYLVKR